MDSLGKKRAAVIGINMAICFVGMCWFLSDSNNSHVDPFRMVVQSALSGAIIGWLLSVGLFSLGYLQSPKPDTTE